MDRVNVFARGTVRAADAAGGADRTPPHSFPAGLALNGPGTRLYAANNLSDTLAVFDVAAADAGSAWSPSAATRWRWRRWPTAPKSTSRRSVTAWCPSWTRTD